MGAYPWAHFNFFHTWLSATGENLAASYPGLALFPNWIYWTWIPNASDPSMPLYCGAMGPRNRGLLTSSVPMRIGSSLFQIGK